MTRRDEWQRVSKRRPCPVCERSDWCLYVGPNDAPEAVICARIESSKRAGEAGWLHRLRDDGPLWTPWRRTVRRAVRSVPTPDSSGADFDRLAAEYQAAMKPQALYKLAGDLGLSVESLRSLSVGWSARRRAWSFPMRDAGGRVVGVRLRLPGGRKLSIKGGKEGLFIPTGLQSGGRLFIAEGPTDTAACLDWGFSAIGRPNCTGGVRHVVELVRRLQPSEVVIVADADESGLRGADRLASALVAYASAVRVITPANGLKDARAWKATGATRAAVQAAIDAVHVRRLTVTTRRRKA